MEKFEDTMKKRKDFFTGSVVSYHTEGIIGSLVCQYRTIAYKHDDLYFDFISQKFIPRYSGFEGKSIPEKYKEGIFFAETRPYFIKNKGSLNSCDKQCLDYDCKVLQKEYNDLFYPEEKPMVRKK